MGPDPSLEYDHSPFADAFTPGMRFRDRGEPVEMSTRELGMLRLPSGRVCVGDPLTTDFTLPGAPLAGELPRGELPVQVAIASFVNGDQRVACARVLCSADAPAVRWEPAHFEGDPPPEGGAVPGYGVDAGMGSFSDVTAQSPSFDEKTSERWLAALEANDVDTWTWHVADVGTANVVMFSSGYGDGFYGTYRGFDAGGRLVELVTDFSVLTEARDASFEVPLPTARGSIEHPLLEQHSITARAPFFSRREIILRGRGARVELSDGSPVQLVTRGNERHYKWEQVAPGTCAIIRVMTGTKPLERW